MKTTVIGSDKAKNTNDVKTNIRPNITGKEAKNENDTTKTSAETPQVETAKIAEVKTDKPATVDNQPANVAP